MSEQATLPNNFLNSIKFLFLCGNNAEFEPKLNSFTLTELLQKKHVKHTFHVCCLVINGYFTARVLFFYLETKIIGVNISSRKFAPNISPPPPKSSLPSTPTLAPPCVMLPKNAYKLF